MDRQLKKRLKYIAEHFVCLSTDGYTGPVMAEVPIIRKCFRQHKISIVRDFSGVEVTTSLRLYFDGLFTVNEHDRFLFGGKLHPPVAYATFDGLGVGQGTTVVYL